MPLSGLPWFDGHIVEGGGACGSEPVFGWVVSVPVGCGEPAGVDVHGQHSGEPGRAELGGAVWV